MTQHLVFFLVCLMGLPAFAQQARVIKTKGYQAIVQFPEGEKPRVGQVIDIGGDEGDADLNDDRKLGTGARAHSLTLSTELGIGSRSTTSGSKESSDSYTKLGVQGRYGWNFEQWEAGPQGAFSMDSSSNVSTTVFAVGGFFDWNLIPNRPGTVFVYGVGGSGVFGQESVSVEGGTSESTGSMMLFGGGQMKWFGLSDSVAARLDAGLAYETSSPKNATPTTIGFKSLAGLSFYF